METIKITRIGGEYRNNTNEVIDYLNPYTGNPSNTWYLFDDGKKIFDNIKFKDITKQEDGTLDEYKMTKSQMEAQIVYSFEDGYVPFIYLFTFEIPSDVWTNREQYAKESNYDDVMEYITDYSNYDWCL